MCQYVPANCEEKTDLLRKLLTKTFLFFVQNAKFSKELKMYIFVKSYIGPWMMPYLQKPTIPTTTDFPFRRFSFGHDNATLKHVVISITSRF